MEIWNIGLRNQLTKLQARPELPRQRQGLVKQLFKSLLQPRAMIL
jgi:hypothetical protein